MELIRTVRGWYRRVYRSRGVIRVDPLTILAVIGIATTAWGMGRGLGAMETADALAQELRSAPARLAGQIDLAQKSGQISGYNHEVARQRVDLLRPVFQQYASLIQDRGTDLGKGALEQGIVESLAGLGPADAAGRLVGGLSSGKGLDQIIGVIFIAKSIDEFELAARPFDAQEAALREQVRLILGLDADRLFLARMRHKVNWARAKWQDLQKEHPDDPAYAEQLLRWEINNRSSWVETPRLVGPGEKWATLNDYIDWMVQQAKVETQPVSAATIQGDAATYIGRAGWWRFGADVAPDKNMCSEISAHALVERLDLQISLNPDERTVSGVFSGHANGNTASLPNDRYEVTFEGGIAPGTAVLLDQGYWEFGSTAEVSLSFSVYAECVSGVLSVDAVVEETVQAQVFGNSRDGVCVWWGEKVASGDFKRDFMLYTPAMKGRCDAALLSIPTPK